MGLASFHTTDRSQSLSTVKDNLAAYINQIELKLDELVPEQAGMDSVLYEAARYSLLNGGKRIRPILTLAVADLFDTPLEKALAPACAIEMIHTYSMIHDDLPCMDDDDFRRGKPSLHKQYPEAIAVLAGDYLLTRAFDIITSEQSLTPLQRSSITAVIAKSAGGPGMIGGQVMDILSENRTIDLQTLQTLHQKKTGALIASAVTIGCLVAEAPQDSMHHLEQYALNIGLAFQVIDDVLDVTSGEKKRGPQSSSDLTNSKSTYVSLLGIDEAKAVADKLVRQAIDSLSHIPQDTTLMKDLAEFVTARDY